MKSLRQRAVGLLARREHSRAELTRKLAADGTPEEIETVLARLEAEGLLSDVRCAEAYVRAHVDRFGTAKLRQVLRTKGIDDALVSAQIETLPDEIERARGVWARKFGARPADAREWARQARFLQSRGFAVDIIRRLLKEPDA